MNSLSDYRGKHKGEDVFVLGAGPSLHFFDTKQLAGKTTICINSSVMKHKETTYYLTSDGNSVGESAWKYVIEGKFPVFFSKTGGLNHLIQKGHIEDESRVCLFGKEHTYVMNPEADFLIFGTSSAHCAVHLAVIMGASRVIIVGCDCEYDGEKEHFFDYPGEEENLYYGKPYPRTPVKRVGRSDGHHYMFFNTWMDIKRNNPTVNIAAFGGMLEKIFPKFV